MRREHLLAWRRILVGTASLVLVTALAACAPEPTTGWEPEGWPTSGLVVDMLPVVEPSAAAPVGLRLRNESVGIDASWAHIPGGHAANAVVDGIVREAVRMQSAAAGIAYKPEVQPAGAGLGQRGCQPGASTQMAIDVLDGRTGTVVVCEVVAARGAIIAQTVRVIVEADGAVPSDVSTTVYADIESGEATTGNELLANDAVWWSSIVDVLRRSAGGLSLAPVAAPTDRQLEELRLILQQARLEDAQIILPIPSTFTAAELQGLEGWRAKQPGAPTFVAVTQSAVEAGLTPMARAILNAAGPFTGRPSSGAGFERTPCDLVPCMALTLDDGPSPLTPGFLDVLRDEQSAATFYMLGQNAQAYPDTVRRVAAEGHEVGNHTWNHAYLTTLTKAEIESQLGRTAELLTRLSGLPVTTFRPPGGFVDANVVAIAGQPAILWSVDTRDWSGPADDALARYAIDAPTVSSIMLMHDIQAGSSRVFAQVVAGLRDRGFSLVTIDALFAGDVPAGIVRHGPTLGP